MTGVSSRSGSPRPGRGARHVSAPPGARPTRLEAFDDEWVPDLTGATDWDVAARYSDFSLPSSRGFISLPRIRSLRQVAVDEILRRARQVLGSVVHPTRHGLASLPDVPRDAMRREIDIETTTGYLAVAPAAGPIKVDDVWMRYELHRDHPLVLCLDASLSMMGENLALMAVAVAVVLLELADDQVGVVTFDDEVRVLRHPQEPLPIIHTIEDLLDSPGRPYTDIEAGVRAALEMCEATGRHDPVSTILLTDGRYTAGRDPAYLASRFDHLLVLRIGTRRSGMPLCTDMARRGRGSLLEVPQLSSLPQVMYRAVRELLRGRP